MNEPAHFINPAHLTYAADDDGLARSRGAYEYSSDSFDKISGLFLFWGPYLDLHAGVYVLNFLGEIEGQFSVEFTHGSGRKRIHEITIDDLRAPACFVLVGSVQEFEIRGVKTRSLGRLRLEGIRLQRVYVPLERS